MEQVDQGNPYRCFCCRFFFRDTLCEKPRAIFCLRQVQRDLIPNPFPKYRGQPVRGAIVNVCCFQSPAFFSLPKGRERVMGGKTSLWVTPSPRGRAHPPAPARPSREESLSVSECSERPTKREEKKTPGTEYFWRRLEAPFGEMILLFFSPVGFNFIKGIICSFFPGDSSKWRERSVTLWLFGGIFGLKLFWESDCFCFHWTRK